MKTIDFIYPSGATPLDPNETDGLIPDYITTQGELNILEQENILDAANWVLGKRDGDILNASFLMDLHHRMLNRVWKWAGKPRRSDKNIGVPKEQIHNQLHLLLNDAKYWIENKTYPLDEIAARFHARLVGIHIFANGNGRHARLMTDLLLRQNGVDPFSWGQKSSTSQIEVEGPIRENYIASLRAADKGDFGPLLKFVRS